MDSIIISLSIGLGVHQTIGVRNFVPVYLGVANALQILLILFLRKDILTEYKKYKLNIQQYRHSVTNIEQYDFIIAGGGAAGCVLANRLSRHFSVLLIEQGGDPHPLTFVPGLESALVARPQTDYMFLTTPQNSSCLSCTDGRSLWTQGKGLGGSGVLNSMMYQRGHPYDYDNWARHTKDHRWKYKNVLPYFLKSEGYCFECEKDTTILTPTNQHYHSAEGELPIMKPYHVPLLKHFLRAASWANIKVQDLNAPYYSSSANVAMYNQRNARRSSAYSSFIQPILKRKNLHVWRYTRVIKVMLDEKSNFAYGVQYERFGNIGIVKAKKEVIISSGALSTPKILMQSGIGPEPHLQQIKIPVRINLPAVGRNLQDHVGTLLPILIDKPLSYIFDRDVNLNSVMDFLYNGTGPLAVPFPVANAFLTSSQAIKSGERDWPDIQMGFAPHGITGNMAEGLSRSSNVRLDVLKKFLDPVAGHDAFFLIVDYGRPKSRGKIRLKSADYREDPLIDPRYYEDPHNEDIRVTVEALQNACYFAETAPAFKKLGARLSPVPFPSCKHKAFKSGAYWECVARHFTLSFHHYTGTAAMGPEGSHRSVVDSELRVFGATNLRIIDSSVIPFVTSANTHAPTMMIAERGADLILKRWLKHKTKWTDEKHFNIDGVPTWRKEAMKLTKGNQFVNENAWKVKIEMEIQKNSKPRLGWDDPLKWFN